MSLVAIVREHFRIRALKRTVDMTRQDIAFLTRSDVDMDDALKAEIILGWLKKIKVLELEIKMARQS